MIFSLAAVAFKGHYHSVSRFTWPWHVNDYMPLFTGLLILWLKMHLFLSLKKKKKNHLCLHVALAFTQMLMIFVSSTFIIWFLKGWLNVNLIHTLPVYPRSLLISNIWISLSLGLLIYGCNYVFKSVFIT